MSLNLSKRTRTILGFILFIPLILSFLIWGIGDMVKAAGITRYAAMVGNSTISMNEYQRAYSQQLEMLRRQGMNIDGEMAKSLGIGNSVIRSMIERELLLQAARDYGIIVNDKMAAQEIQKERAFYNDSGKFDREKFKQLLQNANVNEQEFVAGLRGDMSIRVLLGALQSAAVPPAELARALYVLQNTKYTADIYTLSHNAMQGVGNPSDDELKKYYDEHNDKYQRAEMRSMTMAVLSVKDWQKNLKPSDAELSEMYKSHTTEFSEPEERSVQFVVLQDEAKAKTTAERARGGEKLAAAASAVAGSTVELKRMENVKAGSLPANLDGVVFKLPRAETSEPVNTPLGWYVMQITNIKTGLTPSMDKVKDKLVAAWRNEQASEKLPKLLNELDDGIAGGASLEELSKQYGLHLRQLPMMNANGQGKDANINADGSMKEVLGAGFKQSQGEIGNVFETASGDYAVVRVDEVRAAAIAPLAEIKQQVITDWRGANARQIAEKAARELASAWRSKDNVVDAASKVNAKLTAQNNISRDTTGKNSPTAIERAVMRAAETGEVVTSTDQGAEYVAKLRAVNMPNPASVSPAALGELQTLAGEWAKNDYLQSFLNALEKTHHVEVNQKAITQVYNTAN